MKKISFVFLCCCFSVYCFAKPVSVQRQTLASSALSYLGYPYVYGGKTPSPGMDCSGLVAFCARKAINVNFTGSAQMMYDAATKVNDYEREPGDLLFFSETNSSSNITHVGIYLGKYTNGGELNGKHIFIHSANENVGVICSSIDESNYWTQRYVGTGRFLLSTADANKKVKSGRAKSLESKQKVFEQDKWWDDVDPSWFED